MKSITTVTGEEMYEPVSVSLVGAYGIFTYYTNRLTSIIIVVQAQMGS